MGGWVGVCCCCCCCVVVVGGVGGVGAVNLCHSRGVAKQSSLAGTEQADRVQRAFWRRSAEGGGAPALRCAPVAASLFPAEATEAEPLNFNTFASLLKQLPPQWSRPRLSIGTTLSPQAHTSAHTAPTLGGHFASVQTSTGGCSAEDKTGRQVGLWLLRASPSHGSGPAVFQKGAVIVRWTKGTESFWWVSPGLTE